VPVNLTVNGLAHAITVGPPMTLWRMEALCRFELSFAPQALRNLREVRAMQQQTAYSSWITLPVG
jgi:hypothetical protein